MKTYSFTLNIQIQAKDETEADEMMEHIAWAVRENKPHPYKIGGVEPDDLEEV
jgi:hypothetical protein